MKLAFALYGRRAEEDKDNEKDFGEYEIRYPWLKGEHVLIMGDIENMPGHCVVGRHAGVIHFGYHPDDFLIYSEEEMHSDFEEDGTQSSVGLEDFMVKKTDPDGGREHHCLSLENVKTILAKLNKRTVV